MILEADGQGPGLDQEPPFDGTRRERRLHSFGPHLRAVYRLLYAMQYFHGTTESACLYVRAMALVWNFHPYGQKTQDKYGPRASPFQQLNGFRYHDNWLENMMIAASLRGQRE